jgi:hypothetical protein
LRQYMNQSRPARQEGAQSRRHRRVDQSITLLSSMGCCL